MQSPVKTEAPMTKPAGHSVAFIMTNAHEEDTEVYYQSGLTDLQVNDLAQLNGTHVIWNKNFELAPGVIVDLSKLHKWLCESWWEQIAEGERTKLQESNWGRFPHLFTVFGHPMSCERWGTFCRNNDVAVYKQIVFVNNLK
jgi:hypothetical protein